MNDEELRALNEKKNALAAEILKMADAYSSAGDQFDGEQRKAYDQVNADYNEVHAQVEREVERRSIADRRRQIHDQLASESRSRGLPIPGRESTRESRREDQRGGRQPIDEETRARAFRGWLVATTGADVDLEERDIEAMRACRLSTRGGGRPSAATPRALLRKYQTEFRHGRFDHESPSNEFLDLEQRAMSTVTMATGGSLLPQGFVRSLEYNLLAFGGVRQVASLSVTDNGQPTSMPTFDDTSNEGEYVGESQNVMTESDPTTGAIKWSAYKITSKAFKVPAELLEDAAALYDLPGTIGLALGERIGRRTNRAYTFGTGNGQPRGIITAAETGVTTASATAISYDDVITLEHSVNSAYRAGASYMCSDAIMLHLRKLKDSEGRYLWINGTEPGLPDMLNKRPLTINHSMTSTQATGDIPLLFGQFSRYVIRRVGGIRLYRLVERYRETDEDGFVALLREDGNLINSGTCPLKKLVIG